MRHATRKRARIAAVRGWLRLGQNRGWLASVVDSVKGQVRPNPLLGRGPLVLLCVALLGNIGTSEAQDEGSAKYPLVLSPDARYVVDQLGEPFFINGDTAWSLVVGISKKDAELYLEDRRRRGFNLVLESILSSKTPGRQWNKRQGLGANWSLGPRAPGSRHRFMRRRRPARALGEGLARAAAFCA